MRPIKKPHAGIMAIFIIISVLSVCGLTSLHPMPDTSVAQATVTNDLPVVGSYDNLKKLLENCQSYNHLYGDSAMRTMNTNNEKAASAPGVIGNAADYSQTNVQVQGVDEADLVKTDGNYFYKVNQDQILIISALPETETKLIAWLDKLFTSDYKSIQPAGEMKIVNRIQFNDDKFSPMELYLDDNKLIVIGQAYQETVVNGPYNSKARIMPPYPRRNYSTTRAIIYDIKDKQNIVKLREIELKGNYLTSRKVGSCFYLLSNEYINYYNIQDQGGVAPSYRDTAAGNDYIEQSFAKIHYFPACIQPNYLTIAAIDLNQPESAANVQTYLGSGENVYASTENLYVALNDYDSVKEPVSPKVDDSVYKPQQLNTRIYKFAMQGSSFTYTGEGKVPGTILNQFSIDEYQNHCRIATTSGELWRSDEYGSRNNVYILDQNLQISGKIEDIAPRERIYSTRFMGERAYMVTFRQVDPFFVIDIKDPANPKILGKLKIPGYSDYLHPYDANHIIGFGKETVINKFADGQEQAYYLGMKVAIFDVTDVNNPVEMNKQLIGDRGTNSELLNNHKALLFSKDKGILAFPVTVMQVKNNSNQKPGANSPEYGTFSFQGAYIYKIGLPAGLQLQGTITHLSDEDYLKAGDYGYANDKNIQRVLYIGDTVYTISNGLIKANNLSDLKEIDTLELK